MNVYISEEARRFLSAEVASGRYTSEDAVIEDALRRMREQEQPPTSGRALDNDPLWGMFRDEPELMDQIVQDAMRDRRAIPSISWKPDKCMHATSVDLTSKGC